MGRQKNEGTDYLGNQFDLTRQSVSKISLYFTWFLLKTLFRAWKFVMSAIQNRDTAYLTGFDAFFYEYSANQGIRGVVNGIVSFFLGREVTVTEEQIRLKDCVSNNPLTTKLSQRSTSFAPSEEGCTTKLINSTTHLVPDSLSQPVPKAVDSCACESQTVNEECMKTYAENVATSDDALVQKRSTTDVERPTGSQRQLLDEFSHLFGQEKAQLRSLGDGSDFFNNQPELLNERIFDVLGLSPDFLDQGDSDIIAWLDSSDFMAKAACPETAVLVKHIIHRSVYENNKVLFMDICGSLGSRANMFYQIVFEHEALYQAFFGYYKHLLSDDVQSSSKACRVIGMTLINELDSYLQEIKPPKPQIDVGAAGSIVRWIDQLVSCQRDAIADENQLIDISHGGGRYYLNKFLKREVSGYRLERGCDTGIQVHPYMGEMSILTDAEIKIREMQVYSQKSLQYLDLPARLTAKIPVKHVIAARNPYEGAIAASSIDKLVKPEITVLTHTLLL